VGSRTGPDNVETTKILPPTGSRTPAPRPSGPWLSHCTDCAVAAPDLIESDPDTCHEFFQNDGNYQSFVRAIIPVKTELDCYDSRHNMA
jgi:hypothetical protein